MIASVARDAEAGVRHRPKTAARRRQRGMVEDLRAGLKEPCFMVLTDAAEAAIGALRGYTVLPLDDGFSDLQRSIPHLTRSALHRYFQR